MAPLPMALGCLLAGLMLDRLGRRRSQLLICVPFTAGWVLLALAQDLPAILGGRFLTGLCVGLVGEWQSSPAQPLVISRSQSQTWD